MRKFLSLMLTFAMVLTMFAGCGAPASSAAPAAPAAPASSTPTPATPAPAAAAPVTIKVSTWDLATMPHIEQTAKDFMAANPNITVELVDVPSAEYTNKLSVMLNGGSDVDAFWVKDADTSLGLHQKGQLADLTEYIKRDGIDLSKYNGLAENFVFDGKQSGMPYRTDWYVLFYNKDLFDAAKVAYPTNNMTWKEFEETAKKLTSGEGATKNYGAHFHTWQACVINWAVADGKNTIMTPDMSFAKPTYDMVLRMQNTDKSIMDYATLKTGNIHYSSPFYTGNVAMMPMGTWFMANLIAKAETGETKVNWGVATIPHAEGGVAGQTVGSATPMAINNASKNKDAAWEFVKFATGDAGAKILAASGGLPASSNDELMKIATSIKGMPAGIAEGLDVSSIVLDRPIVEKVGDINKMQGEEHGLIMLGESTVDKGIEAMNTRAKEIMG